MMRIRGGSAAAVLFLLSLNPVSAEEISYQTLVTPLLETGKTILGDAIAYPAGTAKVTGAIITVPPGGETGWHTHAVPLFAYMLDGVLTVDYGTKGIKAYKAGESLVEAMNWPHNGRNLGSVPVRLLAVYMGAEGVPNAAATPK